MEARLRPKAKYIRAPSRRQRIEGGYHPTNPETNVSMNNAAFCHASKNGNVCVLDRLLANERPVALYACTAGAVAGGRLRALEWAFSNGFPLDSFVCHSAASTGNLQMLEWAVDKGCPWDPAQCTDASKQNGHLAVQQIGSFLADYATK